MGEWKLDKRHGWGEPCFWRRLHAPVIVPKLTRVGVYTFADGVRYEGQWHENQKHGMGIWFFSNKCALLL